MLLSPAEGLDLPMCSQDDLDQQAAPPHSLLLDSRLWGPKTRRVEVSVIPRPRPSPVRPRIDPWSFVSAGGAGPGPLCRPPHRRSSANPFTDCDPFPPLNHDPSGTLGHDPDPFCIPFGTSRSAPGSASASPSLSALRAGPFSPTLDSPYIDLGWSPLLDPSEGKKKRRRQQVTGLEPWTSPMHHGTDRF